MHIATAKTQTKVEWLGGIVSLPSFVTGEGEPYRPEALLWADSKGTVIGTTMGKPGELLALAAESLRETIVRPMFGRPQLPERVRVASSALADALRAGHSGLEIVCAPTPELDSFVSALLEKMDGGDEDERSYLSSELEPAAVGAFFRASAGLYRAKPWTVVPSADSLISVSIAELAVTNVALSVIGQLGQSQGFILFSGSDDFDAFLAAAEAIQEGEEPWMPPHFALNFEADADLSPVQRLEVAEQQWELADADAYPALLPVDEDLVARPPTARELTIAEALGLALPRLLEEKAALMAAWDGGEPVARTISVVTHAGELEVLLRVPCEAHENLERPAARLANKAAARARKNARKAARKARKKNR